MSQVAMAQAGTNQAGSSRQIALARRKAMSTGGKSAINRAGRNGGQAGGTSAASAPAPVVAAMSAPAAGGSARAASLARRKAMSTHGKQADSSSDRTRVGTRQQPSMAAATADGSREKDCGCGCGGAGKCGDPVKAETGSIEMTDPSSHPETGFEMTAPSSHPETTASPVSNRRPSRARIHRRPVTASSTAKTAALARRKALSSRGKAGVNNAQISEAQAARASNPKMSGRELAQTLRDQRSRRGNAGQKKSAPCGRLRKPQAANANVGAAQDAPWKVGASETSAGQTVTGTMVGRKDNMTGDEPSTCRTITGTEYLGADIFNTFCQADAHGNSMAPTASKVMVTTTSHGNRISGNRMGRGSNVTGNEPGTCKQVTGGEYVSAEQTQGWCGESGNKSPRKVSMTETMKGKSVTGNNVGRSEKVTGDEYGMRRQLTGTQYTKAADIGNAPAKVGISATLRGGGVTGTMVGRRERMTGDEAGSCRNVTGDDYIGKEQYSGFCNTTPEPKDRKVETSQTLAGLNVTGSLTGRSPTVTGDEPGTCKAVTGTPYAGGEQYQQYCEPEQSSAAQARMTPAGRTWGKSMTGLQPGIGGHLTGAGKGACEPVSGTPYTGADQAAQACPAAAAEPGSADFPQSLDQAPWGDFSTTTPAHAAHYDMSQMNVTGSNYESGNITGPFGMATGKITGTEQARFDRPQAETAAMPATAESIEGRVKSRITGEGMDAGVHITGDDWDRGDRVTGTEGASATRRNPTRTGGPMSTMQTRADMARPQDVPLPVSRVTGGSGNTDKGSLITYSGGARG